MRSSAVLEFLNNISEADVSNYAKLIAAMSLKRISLSLKHSVCWAFSIAFDGATVIASSYIDVRVFYYDLINIKNYHVLAIPIYDEHSGEKMYNLISRLLYTLVGESWKLKLIGIATDGAANIIGIIQGTITRIKNVCESVVYRIWCVTHQLDLVVQDVFEKHVKRFIALFIL